MKANYPVEAGDVHVIRPLVYVREKELRDFSVSNRLPIINENCPACFEQPKVIITLILCYVIRECSILINNNYYLHTMK